MRAYLLNDAGPDGQLYLAFGDDAVSAAKAVIALIGGSEDVNRFSVGGSYPVENGVVIGVSSWWPYFTNDPDRPSAIDMVRGTR